MATEVYHERQKLQFCAVHSINNILQDKNGCTKSDLDRLSTEFSPDSWINPHKSCLGLGNYDVNVIMGFLERKGYNVEWFDKRKPIDDLLLQDVLGVILNCKVNILSSYFSFLPFHHWYAVRSINGKYYNLDSKLREPVLIGGDKEFLAFLARELKAPKTEMLIVRVKDHKETEHS